MRVFIVDDSEAVCRALARFFKSAGILARTFTSAEEFLAQVQTETEGWLISDIRMPGMDGLNLQKLLIEAGSPLHVILITAQEIRRDRDLSLGRGAVAYLVKPIDGEDILDIINSSEKS